MVYLILPLCILLAFGIYLFLIHPGKCDMSQFRGWHFSHRGLHDPEAKIPENTLAAFCRSVDHGYGIELDVHLMGDDKLAVFHDDILVLNDGKKIFLHDSPYSAIEKHPLAGTSHRIPLLSSVLETVAGKVPLIIELKTCPRYRVLCTQVAETLKSYMGVFCIESFDPRIVRWFARNKPGIIRGQLSYSFFKGKSKQSFVSKLIMTNLLTNAFTRPHFIAYLHTHKTNPSFLLCKKLFKAHTVTWNVNSEEEMEQNRYWFDLFIFESFLP